MHFSVYFDTVYMSYIVSNRNFVLRLTCFSVVHVHSSIVAVKNYGTNNSTKFLKAFIILE